MAYCILALDGGGIRGLITACILAKLDKAPAIEGWRQRLNMIAGTSTGGLIALGLGLGKKPEDLVSFYKENGPLIFRSSLLHEIKDVGNLIGAKYPNAALQRTLKKLVGATTKLSDLSPTVVVPSCNLNSTYGFDDGAGATSVMTSWAPKIFNNDTADPNGNDGEELAWQVGMRTSAAPTYFPSFATYTDGGVCANNPSMVAVAQALVGRKKRPNRNLENIVLLSIGTGQRERMVSGRDHDWGDVEWVKAKLFDLLMDGPNDLVRYECQRLLEDRFHRVNPALRDRMIELDDVSPDSLKYMEDLVDTMDLSSVVQWIKKAIVS